ncbi:hypothetical protein ACH5RR_037191 [Cinchona calisaya]|uniref:Uncharacterized protein n=1 Tax=Cinchona calisaya TaxID=153742 RepID=A0ABD2YA49_9GENT
MDATIATISRPSHRKVCVGFDLKARLLQLVWLGIVQWIVSNSKERSDLILLANITPNSNILNSKSKYEFAIFPPKQKKEVGYYSSGLDKL